MVFNEFERKCAPVVRDLEERVRENPSSRLFAPLADTYRRNGDLDRAIALLHQGLFHHPDYCSARVLLARCLEGQEKWEEAQEEWRKVLKVDRANLVALKSMGEICLLLGRLEESRGWFHRYLDEFPGDEAVRMRLDEAEQVMPTRVELCEETIDENGEKVSLETTEEGRGALSDSGERMADPEKKTGSVSAAVDEEDSLETITLAEIYAQQGFYERAIDIYGRILVNNPEEKKIRDRLEALNDKLTRREGLQAIAGEESEEPQGNEDPAGRDDEKHANIDSGREQDEFVQIDVNKASSMELETIPGVGPVIAQKMVVERERNGPFDGREDLERVPGMGVRLMERIGGYLVFTTAVPEDPPSVPGTIEVEAEESLDDYSSGDLDVDSDRDDDWGGEKRGADSEFEEFRRWLKNLRK